MDSFRIDPARLTITRHAEQRAGERGFTRNDVWQAAIDHSIAYWAKPSSRHGHQMRLISGDMCLAFDPETHTVVTVFYNKRTDFRP